MSSVFDAVFGGSATDAADAQVAGNREAMREVRRATEEAKQQVVPLFDDATQERMLRSQQAMNLLQGGFTPQMQAMEQGNMNAQNALSGALPQMQNAILGNGIDYSGIANSQGLNFDPMNFIRSMDSMSRIMSPEDMEAARNRENPLAGVVNSSGDVLDRLNAGSAADANASAAPPSGQPNDSQFIQDLLSGMFSPSVTINNGITNSGMFEPNIPQAPNIPNTPSAPATPPPVIANPNPVAGGGGGDGGGVGAFTLPQNPMLGTGGIDPTGGYGSAFQVISNPFQPAFRTNPTVGNFDFMAR